MNYYQSTKMNGHQNWFLPQNEHVKIECKHISSSEGPLSEELRVALIWLIMRNIQHYILTVSSRYIFCHSCSALLIYPFRQTNTYQTPPYILQCFPILIQYFTLFFFSLYGLKCRHCTLSSMTRQEKHRIF